MTFYYSTELGNVNHRDSTELGNTNHRAPNGWHNPSWSEEKNLWLWCEVLMFISPLLTSGRHPYPGKGYQNDHNPLLQGFAGQSQ